LLSRIYSVDFATNIAKQEQDAKLIGTVMLPLVTGAAISDDGQQFALSTYGPTCLLHRDSKIDWTQASAEERRNANWHLSNTEELEFVPAPPRRQGESVCFDKSGTHLLMTSEGSPMPLWSVEIVKSPRSE
jgi:hypothetical protein